MKDHGYRGRRKLDLAKFNWMVFLVAYGRPTVRGIEFPAGGRFIDILAVDQNNNLVVIELKVSRGYEKTTGQLARYMAWIERELADHGQIVRGVIVAKDISEDLKLAFRSCQMLNCLNTNYHFL